MGLVKFNGEENPCPPYNEGTVLVIDAGGDGKVIRLNSQEEAYWLAEAAKHVAENWNAEN